MRRGQFQQCVTIIDYQKDSNCRLLRVTHLGTSRSPYGEREQLGLVLMTVQLELSESRSMTLNRLTNTPVPAVQLHSTLHFERSRVGSVARDANKNEPFLVSAAAVVDDLCADERGMPVEDLLGRRGSVCCGPMVH